MTIDIEHLKSWIGRKDTAQELLTQTIAERFNATFDRVLPIAEGDAAPLLVHFCLCQPSVPTGMLASDGHPQKGGFLPPVPLPRRMWAGGEIEFHRDIRVGDMVSRVSEIANVQLKEGKTGLLDAFFDAYVEAETATGIGFEDWLRTEYDREQLKTDFLKSGQAKLRLDWFLRRE